MLPSYAIGPKYNFIKFEAKLYHLLVKWLWQVSKTQLNPSLVL